MIDGWIKIHRQILEWRWYSDINVTRLFLHLLLKANFDAKDWQDVTIGRGQLVTSIGRLAEQTSLSIKEVRTALKKLESTGEIVTKGANKFTTITICKYDTYQCLEDEQGQTKGKQRANEGQTKGKQRATTKEIKNDKESKEGEELLFDMDDKSPKRAKFQKPTLHELQEFAFAENLMNVDCNRFFDYYESNGWKVGRNAMKDWRATLRNWNRTPQNTNNQQFNNKNYGTNQQTDAERLKVPHIGTFTDEQFDAICEMGRMLSKQNASD